MGRNAKCAIEAAAPAPFTPETTKLTEASYVLLGSTQVAAPTIGGLQELFK